jgi:hypothetical protein
VARDKRLHRAEARRRYRERLRAQAAEAAQAPGSGESGPTSEAAARPRRSFVDALTEWKLPDVRADLLAMPSVARRSWALAAAALGIAAGYLVGLERDVFMLTEGTDEPIASRLIFQFTLLPPPVTVVFVGAVLAPRANWLVGGLVGLGASFAFLALYAMHGPPPYLGEYPPLDGAVAFQLVTLYLPIYVLLGGFAGWYRRWIIGRQQRNRQAFEQRRREKARETRRAGRR